MVGVDECQVVFEHPKHGAEFEDICTDLVKRGPATGIVLILATQRPDAKSLPTGISANAVLRMCLKVMGQTENDMVLGTSAYKNGVRATMFAFSDKGICYFAGEGEDAPHRARLLPRRPGAPRRSPCGPGACANAPEPCPGTPSGQEPDTGPAFDLLADLAAVVTEPKMWSEDRRHPAGRAAARRVPGVGRPRARRPRRAAHRRAQALRHPHRAGVGHHRRRQGREPARHHPRRPHQSHHRT